MLRPRTLTPVIAALALLTYALIFTPVAVTQSNLARLSPTPPVKLAPASTTATTPSGPPDQLPKTGLDSWLVLVVGLGLVATGAGLRRGLAGTPSRGSV